MGNMTTLQILQGIKTWVTTKLNLKQDVINDLTNIRSGAQAGATAVQPAELSAYFNDASYDSNAHRINFYHGQTVVAYIDASPFIIDGMVDDVRIENGYLVIDFNTASGKQDISIPLTDIFNPNNYYNKTQTDGLLAQKQDVIQDLADIRSGASAGSTAVQPSTLNNAVKNVVAESGVYDVSANNDNTKFESLSALLSSANLNTLIPTDIRKGGMSIKFVLSSDNNYVQCRYMLPYGGNTTAENNKFVNPTNWQEVDEEPTAGSHNLVKSGGVLREIQKNASWDNIEEHFGSIGNGAIIDSSTNMYKLIPINYGDTLNIKFPSNAVWWAIISKAPSSINKNYTFASGESRRAAAANQNETITINAANAKFLLLQTHVTVSNESVAAYPAYLSINTTQYLPSLEARMKNLEDYSELYKEGVLVDSSHGVLGGVDTTTNSYGYSTTRLIFTFYLNAGDKIDFSIDSSHQYYFHFLSDKYVINPKLLKRFISTGDSGEWKATKTTYQAPTGTHSCVVLIKKNSGGTITLDELSSIAIVRTPLDFIGTNDKHFNDLNEICTLDISRYNGNVSYNSLSAALEAVPVFERKSGIAVRFYNSTTSKYEEWYYKKNYENTSAGNTAFVNPENWYSLIAIENDYFSKYIDSFEKGYYINLDGTLKENTDWCVSPKVPVTNTDILKWKSGYTSTDWYISICFFDSSGHFLGYTSKGSHTERTIDLSSNEDWATVSYVICSFYIPAKNGYLKVNDEAVINFNNDLVSKLLSQQKYVLKEDLKEDLDEVEQELSLLEPFVTGDYSKDIVFQNKHKESALCANVVYKGPYNTEIKTDNKLSILFFTDLHGNATNLSRVIIYKNYYSSLLDIAIHGGDTVQNVITQPNVFETTEGAGSILNVAGNHEAWLQTSDNDYLATEKQVYDKIFANSIADWDVQYTADKCYYYKDIRNFRLIVLDNIHWHTGGNAGIIDDATAQQTWFEGVLADAITNNKIVVGAMHYPPVHITPLDGVKGFNDFGVTSSTNIGDGWYAHDDIFGCVDTFITNGGKFAGWMIGHTHRDYIGHVGGHVNQPIIVTGTAGSGSETSRNITGTNSQDNFNIITFSWVNNSVHLIKILRVGNDMDMYGRSRKSLSFNIVDGSVLEVE